MTPAFRRRALVITFALGAPVAGLAACSYNPELGRQQVMLVDPAALSQQGAQAWAQMKQTQRVSTDAAMNNRVRRVGQQIV
ncbi:MAG: M48 family peptidase, partial [Pseudomonadota bacterium]